LYRSGCTPNSASGGSASVRGGQGNTAGGFGTIVIGGQNVTPDDKDLSIPPQPPFP